jgi:hypothetical protein
MRAPRRARRACTIHLVIRALAYAIACPVASAAQVAISQTPVRVGDPFPHLVGQSLADRTIDLPVMGAVRPTVVILSFSREGGNDAQQWAERLSVEPMRTETDVVVVAELESVPRLLRGSVRYMIKRGVPPSLRERMLILDRDEATWRERLGVKSAARSYAVLVDSAGSVRWMSDGPCDDDQVARVLTAIRTPRAGGTSP